MDINWSRYIEIARAQDLGSAGLPEKAGTDGANNPYLPENLTEDFDMKPWLDSIFNPSNSQQ